MDDLSIITKIGIVILFIILIFFIAKGVDIKDID